MARKSLCPDWWLVENPLSRVWGDTLSSSCWSLSAVFPTRLSFATAYFKETAETMPKPFICLLMVKLSYFSVFLCNQVCYNCNVILGIPRHTIIAAAGTLPQKCILMITLKDLAIPILLFPTVLHWLSCWNSFHCNILPVKLLPDAWA